MRELNIFPISVSKKQKTTKIPFNQLLSVPRGLVFIVCLEMSLGGWDGTGVF
jgi:hypothetical protein